MAMASEPVPEPATNIVEPSADSDSLPVPDPATSVPVPTPAISVPVPEPATSMPVPEPATSMPVPEPATSFPVPEPATSMPVPEPATSFPVPEPATVKLSLAGARPISVKSTWEYMPFSEATPAKTLPSIAQDTVTVP